jgi:uncharacterized membrane protein
MILILVLIVLIQQVLDGLSTYIIIKRKGGREQNVCIKWLMDKLGFYTPLVAKVILFPIFVWYLPIIAALAIPLYCWVLWHNSKSL